MSEPLVFDPNHPEVLYDWFQAEVGVLHTNSTYNAWVFLDDDRRVVDWWLTDIEDRWVGSDDDPLSETPAFEQLASRARAVGTSNIIGIHHHPPGSPHGPCRGLMEFMAAAFEQLSTSDIQLRAIVIGLGDRIDGVLYGEHIEMSEADFNNEMIREGEALRKIFAGYSQDGVDGADQLVVVIDEILRSLRTGDAPDISLIEEGLQIVKRDLNDPAVNEAVDALLALAPKPAPKKQRSLLDLPELDVRKMDYLN